MIYGTSHLLIGGVYFQGEGRVKILLCKVGGRYMKTKNIGGMRFVNSTRSAKKAPMQKCAKNAKQLSNIEKFFLARFAHSAFYKIYISGAANRHVPVQYAKYVCFFLFFFLSSHHDTNSLLHLYHFRKNIIIYWLILTQSH